MLTEPSVLLIDVFYLIILIEIKFVKVGVCFCVFCRQRTPSTVKQKQRMRFQTKLLLLKQEHEQNSGKDDLPQRARKSPLSSTTMFKSTKLPQFAETAAMATHVIDVS